MAISTRLLLWPEALRTIRTFFAKLICGNENVRAQRALHTSTFVRISAYDKISLIGIPGILHHFLGRGIERKEVFCNDTDRGDFIDRLAAIVKEGAAVRELG